MTYSYDGVSIVLITITATLVSEGLNWFLVYRHPSFKKANDELEKSLLKLDAAKREATNTGTAVGSLVKDKGAKKLKTLEDHVAACQAKVAGLRFRTMIVTGIALLAAFEVTRRWYTGTSVAKLPFTPPRLFHAISRRGLSSTDLTDCASTLVYMLCSVSIRSNIIKALGFGASRTVAKFTGFESMMHRIDEAAMKAA